MGTYLSVYSGLATIRLNGSELVLELGGRSVPLVAVENDLYLDGKTPMHFLPEADGPTEYVVIDDMPYQRLERDASFVPDPRFWKRYVGTYTA